MRKLRRRGLGFGKEDDWFFPTLCFPLCKRVLRRPCYASPLLRAVVRGTPDTGRAKEQAQVNCSALHDWLDGNRRGELTGLAVEGTQLGKLVQSRQHAQQAHWVLTLGATHRSAR